MNLDITAWFESLRKLYYILKSKLALQVPVYHKFRYKHKTKVFKTFL